MLNIDKLKNILKGIKNIFINIFQADAIYFFGSKVNNNQKDRDIDFLVKLKQKIGNQKIDVILNYDKNRTIEQTALKNGILLSNI